MSLHSDDLSSWFDSLEDVQPEYEPIKVWSLAQFFKPRGKTDDNLLNLIKIEAKEFYEQHKDDFKATKESATFIIRQKYGLYKYENSLNLCKDNLVPIKDVRYVIFSSHENRYYLRTYRNYSLNMLYFYTRDIDFSGQSEEIENLRRYVYDGNVYLLFDETHMIETKEFLSRLWKSQFNSSGQIRYKDYIDLLTQSIDLEDYKEYSRELTGHKTIINQFQLRINAIWDKAHATKI